ncbi:MAG: universal stress protein [Acidobacteriota bacterium]|jgi:nucleotide-binding universal stress UspA family protein
MISIKKILCPTDFSEHSREALAHAVSVAKWYASEITLLHVSAPPASSEPLLYGPGMPSLEPEARERLLEKLARFAQPVEEAGVPVHVLLDEGPVVERILVCGEAMGADLIILGTHGLSGFQRLVLGSVTEKVLRRSVSPVMTVPRAASSAVPGVILFKTILCPVDFSPSSTGALELALSIAAEASSRLIVLHVVETLPPEDRRALVPYGMEEYVSILEADAKKRIQDLIPAEMQEKLHPEVLVASGKPHREIARIADERKVGVIVMGVRGRGSLDSMLFGSTTSHVVRSVMCPVLTFRNEPEPRRR